MNEFNLSEKIRTPVNIKNNSFDVINVSDVKDFIKMLKGNLRKKQYPFTYDDFFIEIDKLAGKDLVENSKVSGGKDE